MEELDIGGKVQAFRKMRGMKIKELADITGITASMLSQIERGLVNPSINSLKVVGKALGVPIFLFFKGDSQKDLVVRADKRRILTRPDEQDMVYELLTPDVTGRIEFCMMRVPPQCKSSAAAQSHDGEEVAHVIEGNVDIVVNGVNHSLRPGDSIRIPPHTEHQWVNTSNKKTARVIFAVTPPTF